MHRNKARYLSGFDPSMVTQRRIKALTIISLISAIILFFAMYLVLERIKYESSINLPPITKVSSPVKSAQNKAIITHTEDKIPPIMQKIAWCESRDRQYNPDGTVFRGKINPNDIGKFQINSVVWGETAKKLGYNIYTLKGNTEMAEYIFYHFGAKQWYCSSGCWS